MGDKLIEPEEILKILEQLEKSNDQYTGITFSTRQYFFADPLVPMQPGYPAVGNKLAWEIFKNKNKPGYYVSIDANNFKLVNTYGHDVGDNVIKLIGQALRKATDGLTNSKLFRAGGDEFLFYTEKSDEIDLFVSKACKLLDGIEPVGKSIKITLSFGIGRSYSEAEEALTKAKAKKNEVPNIIFSLIKY
jgi:diguanylate cyclase (GGDEF)-like protein